MKMKRVEVVTHCTLGGMDVAVEEMGLGYMGALVARDALIQHLIAQGQGASIPSWNDRPGRKEAEVIEELRLAAKDLRNSVSE